MRLSAIVLARVFYFVESIDLNPRGATYYPELVQALVERFGFKKYPQKPEDFDEDKGVAFEMGRLHGDTIEKFTIFSNALFLDTRSSTKDSERILTETLEWASKELGIMYSPKMITRKGYVSQLTFHGDADLGGLNPVLPKLAETISKTVSKGFGREVEYAAWSFSFNYDTSTTGFQLTPFLIERRANTPLAENKYYSVAPVQTDEHLKLLEAIESVMMEQ